MIFDVLTLYTELIDEYAKTGVIGRGVAAGAIGINSHNIRDYTLNKHGCVDDYPYGGGAGMVMMPQPVYDCVMNVKKDRSVPVVYFSPKGRRFDAKIAKEYSACDAVILLCGHFEGVDQRALDLCVTDEISIGDFVMTGGHLAAMCFIDTVARYVPGVLGNEASTDDESFESGLLEYEQYTRPQEFMGLKVPDVLLSGHHANIEKYQLERSLILTRQKRPDLIQDEKKS
jgi:tRNA (guanine37-N1)-methyltransferase